MASLLSGITSYYALEGNGNDNLGANNGTPTNATFGVIYGKIEQGVNFVGTGQIICDPSTLPTGIVPLSISFWFKTTGPSFQSFLSFGREGQGRIFSALIYQNILYIASEGFNVNSGVNVADGLWHHCVMVSDTTKGLIYVDGVFKKSEPYVYNFSTSTIFIGGYWSGYNRFPATASIDEVGFWDRVLTPEEVSLLWNDGIGLTYPFVEVTPEEVSPPTTDSPSFLLNII